MPYSCQQNWLFCTVWNQQHGTEGSNNGFILTLSSSCVIHLVSCKGISAVPLYYFTWLCCLEAPLQDIPVMILINSLFIFQGLWYWTSLSKLSKSYIHQWRPKPTSNDTLSHTWNLFFMTYASPEPLAFTLFEFFDYSPSPHSQGFAKEIWRSNRVIKSDLTLVSIHVIWVMMSHQKYEGV